MLLHGGPMALIYALFAYLLAVPVWDSDFWWHIASGRSIVAAGTLPAADPFGVFEGGNPIRTDTVLKGQWLGQVLLYGVYSLGQLDAVVAFRVLLLLASLYLIQSRLRLLHVPNGLASIILLVAGFALYGFTGDRPQLFSILLMALSFWCVDKSNCSQSARYYWPLPAIALLWAQIHGGVILAWVLLLGYGLLWGALQLRGRQWSPRYPTFLLAVAGFGLATLLTPNGFTSYAYILNLQGSNLQQLTSEYSSSLLIYQLGNWAQQGWIVAALAMALVGGLGLLRRSLCQAALVVVLLGLSVESYRYLVFLVVVALPYAGAGLDALAKDLALPKDKGWVDSPLAAIGARWSTLLVALLLLGLLLGPYSADRTQIFTSRYPVELGTHLEGQQGKVMSVMRWGGYLLWLNPALVPYVDGRMLDDAKLQPYTHMLWATPAGVPWFMQQDFAWVLLPQRAPTGEPYQLTAYLRQHPGWRLVAQNAQGVLFKAN